MKLTKNQVDKIIQTFPIGYYAQRRIDAVLGTKGKDKGASYYDITNDNICISYKQVTKGIENISDYQSALVILRSNFYHEVSHAIATPAHLSNNNAINIAEDERIERLFKDYYYGIDFKKSLHALNGYPPPMLASSPLSMWFALCRYGIGKPKFVQKFNDIMGKHGSILRDATIPQAASYYDDLMALYKELETDMQQDPQPYIDMANGDFTDANIQMQQQRMGEAQEGNSLHGQGEEKNNFLDELKKAVQRTLTNPALVKFQENIAMLFENFRKKNAGGCTLQGYSGVINPRLTDRKDYRFFERTTPLRGNNMFGSFHLNLFIDTSGSYHGNTNVTNGILSVLENLERKYCFFTFDVVTLGTPDVEQILPKTKRRIQCYGGNYLSKKVADYYRKLQKPMTYNYNIVLFDGDAYSNPCPSCGSAYAYNCNGQGFATFGSGNTTIISDRENQDYIQRYAPSVRTIYTKCYVEELCNNVLLALQKALA